MNKISSLFKWLYQVIRKVDKYNTTLESCKGKLFPTLITLSEKNEEEDYFQQLLWATVVRGY